MVDRRLFPSDSLIVDCRLLPSPSHLYSQLASHLFSIPLTPLTLSRFIALCRPVNDRVLVLVGCEELLRDDPMVLWIMLHLQEVAGLRLRVLLVSSKPVHEFAQVFDNVTPILVKDKKDENDLVNKVLKKGCPADLEEEIYRGLVKSIYSIAKDQISDAETLAAYVSKILPTFREISERRNSIFPGFC